MYEQTVVSTSPLAASMDGRNFHDQWEFLPERWLGENKQDTLEASQPFSLGTRGCMGKRQVNLTSVFYHTAKLQALWLLTLHAWEQFGLAGTAHHSGKAVLFVRLFTRKQRCRLASRFKNAYFVEQAKVDGQGGSPEDVENCIEVIYQ